jgi:hypothetical protein
MRMFMSAPVDRLRGTIVGECGNSGAGSSVFAEKVWVRIEYFASQVPGKEKGAVQHENVLSVARIPGAGIVLLRVLPGYPQNSRKGCCPSVDVPRANKKH